MLWFGNQVHKQGIALGRSVDLTKFNDYDELIAELDRMFDFDGELKGPGKNWLIVYTDNEGDMMLVGDDPWQYVFEPVCFYFYSFFVVISIFIYSSELICIDCFNRSFLWMFLALNGILTVLWFIEYWR